MKKRWKVWLSFVLVMVLSVSFSVPVFAVTGSNYSGSVSFSTVYCTSSADLVFNTSNLKYYSYVNGVCYVSCSASGPCNLEAIFGKAFEVSSESGYLEIAFNANFTPSVSSQYVAGSGTSSFRINQIYFNFNGTPYALTRRSGNEWSGRFYIPVNAHFYVDSLTATFSFDCTFSSYMSHQLDSTSPALSINTLSVSYASTYFAYAFHSSGEVTSSHIQNQTNSINGNITQQTQNQTNSINNNITQQTQNQTNSINNKIAQETQNQTNTLTTGYDNSGMSSDNDRLASSMDSFDSAESQVTDQSVSYIDAVTFFDPTTHLQLMSCITITSTFLQNLFVALGDWSVLVMIALSLAFALMLIGWFKYRK